MRHGNICWEVAAHRVGTISINKYRIREQGLTRSRGMALPTKIIYYLSIPFSSCFGKISDRSLAFLHRLALQRQHIFKKSINSVGYIPPNTSAASQLSWTRRDTYVRILLGVNTKIDHSLNPGLVDSFLKSLGLSCYRRAQSYRCSLHVEIGEQLQIPTAPVSAHARGRLWSTKCLVACYRSFGPPYTEWRIK